MSGEVFNPFPGLRPFEADEDYLFFGRGEHTDELLRGLREHRFLAVIGASGSGKSSLVRAGMLPALYGGFMVGAGPDWRVAVMRPGGDPIGNLARALRAPDVLDDGTAEDELEDWQDLGDLELSMTKATLRRSSHGLQQVVHEARLPEGTNLLVLVDQFEELFRFREGRRNRAADDATALVNLLLQASRQEQHQVFVVITMRSDFLGDCAQFPGLPEAINSGDYLVPRLSRQQRKEAISGPVGVGGAALSPPLLQRLLNDVGDSPDQLPILQHALMRTFDFWLEGRDAALDRPIGLEDYEAIGGMESAMHRHAEETLELVPEADRPLAEKLFAALTEESSESRKIRRPTRFGQLCAVVGGEPAALRRVIDIFRASGRAFLRPAADQPIEEDTVIDISHESLMRVWGRLTGWVEEEGRSAWFYTQLARTAEAHEQGRAALWRPPDLDLALQLRDQITEAWADRHLAGTFAESMKFVDLSLEAWQQEMHRQEQHRRKEIRQARRITVLVCAALLMAIVFGLWTMRQNAEIRRAAAITLSRELSLEAENLAERNHELALLLAIEAGRASSTIEAERTLRRRLRQAGRSVALLAGHQDDIVSAEFDPGGQRLLTASRDQTAAIWQVGSGGRPLLLRGHEEKIWSATWSQDGERIVTASADETARIWAAESGDPLQVLSGHGSMVRDAAWSPSGQWVATAGFDRKIRVWDAREGRQRRALEGHTGFVERLFWPQENRLVSTALDQTVRLWNPETGGQVAVLASHATIVRSSAWSAAGDHGPAAVVTGTDGGEVAIWDLDGRALWQAAGHGDWVTALAPRGSVLAVGLRDGSLLLYARDAPDPLWRERSNRDAINHIAWHRDGRYLATAGSDGTARVVAAEDGRQVAVLTGHQDAVLDIEWQPGGQLLATVSKDGTARLWEVARGTEAPVIEADHGPIWSARWAPDGEHLATGAADGTVLVWHAASAAAARLEAHHEDVLAVEYSHEGDRLVSADRAGYVAVWDVAGGRLLHALEDHIGAVRVARWSPDDRRLLTAGYDRVLRIWDASAGELSEILEGHEDWIHEALWSPDGSLIASAADDGTIRLWDPAAGTELRILEGHISAVRALAWSPDGRSLASSGTDHTVRLWSPETGSGAVFDGGEEGHEGWVLSVAWSHDGRRLASAGDRVVIWDVASRRLLVALDQDESIVRRVAWSADDSRLLTAGDDGVARLWSSADGSEIAALEGRGAALTHAEWNAAGDRILTADRGGAVNIFLASLDDLMEAACQRTIRELTAAERRRYPAIDHPAATCPGKAVP